MSWRAEVLILPALAATVLLFIGGILVAAAQSFGLLSAYGSSVPTLQHYQSLIQSREFQASLWLTLRVSVLSTLIAAAGALLISAAIRGIIDRWRVLPSLLQIPIAVPHVAMAVAVIQLIAPSGLVARAAHSLGLIATSAEFPVLINDRFGSGIIIVYVLKELPFLAVMCVTVLLRTGDEYFDLARTLGASRWQRLCFVTVPAVAPVLAAGSAIVFAFVFSGFEIPYVLGQPYPAMLGVLVQRKFVSADLSERPQAMAAAMLTAIIAVVGICIAASLRKRFERIYQDGNGN